MITRTAVFFGISLSLSSALGATIEIDNTTNSGPTIIRVKGPIQVSDATDFQARTRHVQDAVVVLASEGGSVVAGIQIGEEIRRRKFDTAVVNHTECVSACALIWLGGTRRYMGANAKIGFHAAYIKQGTDNRESGVGNALVGAYLTRLGLPYSAVAFASEASPDSMTWLDLNSAKNVGIAVSLLLNDAEFSKAIQARYSAGWDRRRCSDFDKLARSITDYGRLIFFQRLRDNCDRNDLGSQIEKLSRDYAMLPNTARSAPSANINAVRRKLEAGKRFSDVELSLFSLSHVYEWSVTNTDPESAQAIAASILMYYRSIVYPRYLALSEAATSEMRPPGVSLAALKSYVGRPN